MMNAPSPAASTASCVATTLATVGPESRPIAFVCVTCGTQHAPTAHPPPVCRICTDDRQHVGWLGQEWTTHDRLAASLHNRIEMDGDLLGVGIVERFAIPQRGLLAPTDAGNVLWDCISVVTDHAVRQLNAAGGVDAIAISHPHFYSAMVEWSNAFGGVPIHLHHADRNWIAYPAPQVRWWTGDELRLSTTVRLIHLPGHFPGSAALHWTDAPGGRSVLLAGDSIHVAGDRRHISVMHSVPNFLPVGPSTIHDLRRRLHGLEIDDVYGFTWGLNIIGNARAAVDESFERYLDHISR